MRTETTATKAFDALLSALSGIHRAQELGASLRLADFLQEELHGIHCADRMQDFAKQPHAIELFLEEQQFFFARAGASDVDGREDPLIGELAIQVDLHIARALEFLEDDVIHSTAGVDERRRDNRQAAAFFDIASRAEKAFRALQRVRVDTA